MELRPIQKEALRALKNNRHVVLVAPTGSGKSLIFERHHLSAHKRTILLTPLIALARQQATSFSLLGVSVFRGFGHSLNYPTQRESGVWIVSPEFLERNFERIQAWAPTFLVVDEAHCVWEWSEGFREEFSTVYRAIQKWNLEQSFWCTATLPPAAKFEILGKLPSDTLQIGEFSVPKNISLDLIMAGPEDKLSTIEFLLSARKNDFGIIFVNTRAQAENLNLWLQSQGHVVCFYHAGISVEERAAVEFKVKNKKCSVLIATSAFGLGMDFSHLSYGVMFQPSFSLLALAQAVGRVGRSGLSALFTILWHPNDFLELNWLVESSATRAQNLAEVEAWCLSNHCKVALLELYFSTNSRNSVPCGRCSSCVRLLHGGKLQ